MLTNPPTICPRIRPTNEIQAERTFFFFFLSCVFSGVCDSSKYIIVLYPHAGVERAGVPAARGRERKQQLGAAALVEAVGRVGRVAPPLQLLRGLGVDGVGERLVEKHLRRELEAAPA